MWHHRHRSARLELGGENAGPKFRALNTGSSMRRSVLLIGGSTLALALAASLVACGGGGEPKTTPAATVAATATAAPTGEATATSAPALPTPAETPTTTPPFLGFGCPTQWQKYGCPSVSGTANGLTLPYAAGAEAEIMCKNVEFYTSGVVNDVSMLYRLPPNTEIVAPAGGPVISVRSSPAPHEYVKEIAIGIDPFLIYIYFVGEIKVAQDAVVARGDVIGVITGTFPTDSEPDSRLNGASMFINLLGYDSKMADASSPTVWAEGVPSCHAP